MRPPSTLALTAAAWLAGTACFAGPTAASAKETSVKKAASTEIDRLARYEPPEDWTVKRSGTIDPSVEIKNWRHRIRIRLFGGEGSRYAEPADFLDGFEARSLGALPKRGRALRVSGRRTRLFKRRYPIELGSPHEERASESKLADEEFCIVPTGERFFVLSYAYESAVPDLEDTEAEVWRPFLKSFKLIKRRRGKKSAPRKRGKK